MVVGNDCYIIDSGSIVFQLTVAATATVIEKEEEEEEADQIDSSWLIP